MTRPRTRRRGRVGAGVVKPTIARPSAQLTDLAAVFAQGYLRLTQKPRKHAESSPEKAVDLSRKQSADVSEDSRSRRAS